MLPAWIDPESWDAFRAMRKTIRAPLTPYAEKLIILQLVRLKSAGEDPQRCLDQSIMLAWRDVFPVRDKGLRQSATSVAETRAYLDAEAQRKCGPPPAAVAEKLAALRRVA